jgi:hypothetical protein
MKPNNIIDFPALTSSNAMIEKALQTNKKKATTRAFELVQSYRDMMNKDSDRLLASDLSCVVYLFINENGDPCAASYKGRSKKRTFNYRFESLKGRDQYVSEWIVSIASDVARNAIKPRSLIVGDVLVASWGWEQTNIDYYKVVALVGTQSVEIVEVGATRDHDNLAMTGTCTPNPYEIVGEAMIKRVNGDSVTINSHIYASKLESSVVNGQRTFKKSHFTTYA